MTQITVELLMDLSQLWHLSKDLAEAVPPVKLLCILNNITQQKTKKYFCTAFFEVKWL